MEWPANVGPLLPDDTAVVRIEPDDNGSRRITIDEI